MKPKDCSEEEKEEFKKTKTTRMLNCERIVIDSDANRWGNDENSERLYFLGLLNHSGW